jgi:hypothetical protein
MHGDLSPKADIFSFGVVVLEIISGRKNSSFVPLPPPDSDLNSSVPLVESEAFVRAFSPGSTLEPGLKVFRRRGLK